MGRGGRYNKKPYEHISLTGEKIIFDSYPEAYRFGILENMQAQGLIHFLRRQPDYPFYINNLEAWIYRSDFEYQELNPDGTAGDWITEEVKSSFTNREAGWNLKRKAFELTELGKAPHEMPRRLIVKVINKRRPN